MDEGRADGLMRARPGWFGGFVDLAPELRRGRLHTANGGVAFLENLLRS